MRRPYVGLVLSLAACVPRTAPAPSVMPEATPGRVVYHTRIRIDPATASLDARSTLRYVADEHTAVEVGFLLNRGLDLQAVRGVAVRSYRSAPFEAESSWTLTKVELTGVSPGSVVTLDLAYSGKPDFPANGINGISTARVELNVESQWHPIFATFDQEMAGVLQVDLPASWSVVASGQASVQGGAHVIRNTIPQLDVAFVAAPSFEPMSSERFTVYYQRSDRRTAAAVLTAADSCGAYLNARYGARDPLPDGKLVLAERPGASYGRKNFIVLSRVDLGHQEGRYIVLCHELAHYWTRTAGASSPHHWMTEAFANYVAGRYIRDHFGLPAFDSLAAQWEARGRGHGPVWTAQSTRRTSGAAMYNRAPYLLYRLEQMIGTERFDRFLTRYMTEGVRTTPELLDRLRDAAGAEAERWFREELARP